ncbi:u3 small nucleolar RNA-associated protein 14 homolog B [Caerostris extrusa]|uniref:U3 small nucleolar RNA-associated protein 14 homolog B n=1 Tax=Caerostris extrusa TaxID=172846 RepID=A0AAV4US62_CAEEX|nr:u3 small nucleolar RNA-associated protein 14 homolog B [Caerostris extrusa]
MFGNRFLGEEKRAAEDKRPKGLNLFLPGWGSWVGKGIKQSKSKKRRFLIKLPEEPAPKKNTLGNVIINEDGDKKASAYQVKQLPFPFSNVTQFERHIQQPVSHTWVPPSSLRNLTAPKTVTKAGKIIEPIDAEDVVLEKTTKKPRQQKKKKEKVPVGVTNGAASFQRSIDNIIYKSKVSKVEFNFPSQKTVNTLESLKVDVVDISLAAIEEGTPFRVETDATDFIIGATLSQAERSIAFFFRTLNKSEEITLPSKRSLCYSRFFALLETLFNWKVF